MSALPDSRTGTSEAHGSHSMSGSPDSIEELSATIQEITPALCLSSVILFLPAGTSGLYFQQ